MLVGVAVVLGSGVGCNPISLAYFLFRGDQKALPDHPLPVKADKAEVTVAVIVTAPNVPIEFAGIDRDLAAQVAKRLADATKDGKAPLKPVDRAKIDKLRADPQFGALSAAQVGKKLGADYVIELTVASVSLYEPQTGKMIYMGQATIEGAVYDSATGEQTAKYFVTPRLETRPTTDVLLQQYKTKLLNRMADEVAWKHTPHANDQQITPAAGF
jgi:hypothetical protein